MIDLNNPYLGEQQKQDLLAIEVSKEYRKEKEQMEQAGMPFSSSSYWLITIRQFMELTKASNQLDTMFSGELKENLYHPDYQVLLMEHDRVKAGEWDNFHRRFNAVGYQNVCAIGVNGFLKGELPKNLEEVDSDEFEGGVFCPTWEQVGEQIENYEETAYWCKQRNNFIPIGIWDIPIEELTEFEEQRVYKRTYIFSKYYELLMEKEVKCLREQCLKFMQNKEKEKSKQVRNGFSCLSINTRKIKKSGKK